MKGPRQRRRKCGKIDSETLPGSGIQGLINSVELGCGFGPIIQRSLQGRRALRYNCATPELAVDDDQRPIPATGLQ